MTTTGPLCDTIRCDDAATRYATDGRETIVACDRHADPDDLALPAGVVTADTLQPGQIVYGIGGPGIIGRTVAAVRPSPLGARRTLTIHDGAHGTRVALDVTDTELVWTRA